MMRATPRSPLLFTSLVTMALLLLSCEVGEEPIGPTDTETDGSPQLSLDSIPEAQAAGLEIVVNATSIAASYSTTQDVIVWAFDPDARTPLSGKTVRFAATRGLIDASAVTADDGKATVVYSAAPFNGDIVLTARTEIDGEPVAVKRTVALAGVQLTLAPQRENALLHEQVMLYLSLRDAVGAAVSGAALTLVVDGDSSTHTTPGSGDLALPITSASEKAVAICAAANGAEAADTVSFWVNMPSGGLDSLDAIRSLRIYPSKSQLRADNSDYAIITAILVTEANNPAVGDTVFFEVDDYAIIDAFGVADSSGRATAILRASPVNGVCHVLAYAPASNDSAATEVLLTGVSLELVPDFTERMVNEYVTVDAYLRDASGNPVGGDQITFTVSGGTFEGGGVTHLGHLDQSGHASVRVTSGQAGTATVRAVSQNTGDSVAVDFTMNTLEFVGTPASIAVGGADSVRLTVWYRDGAGAAIAGADIAFATNAGIVRPPTARTGADGRASTWLISADFAATATVQASAPGGDALTTVTFNAAEAASIALAVTPDNIGVKGGVAELIATVRDRNGNMVSGAAVNFRIERGPGGGEQIDQPVVVCHGGIARSTLTAGSLPSMYRAVEVSATAGAVGDTTKLTISGPPHIISVARPESDTVDVPNAGEQSESTFEYYAGAVVQDINGNPVADGTEVHFSAVVSGMAVYLKRFVRWSGEGSAAEELKAVLEYVRIDIPFEDINNNFRMDPTIDLTLDDHDDVASRGDDWNGDGIVDYLPSTHDFFWDFNLNGICDTGVGAGGEPYYAASRRIDHIASVDTIVNGTDTVLFDTVYTYEIWADLNDNGVYDAREWVDYNRNGRNDLPGAALVSPLRFDFDFWRWERLPIYGFRGFRFDFDNNDFAVVIASSATTVDGVAQARLTYPRQFARKLFVTVNAETNGIHDRDGERFVLPILR